jgi:hypothetical protein
LTHSLKGAWFQPLNLYEVKNWFQAFAFKWVNLYRYNAAATNQAIHVYGVPFGACPPGGGLYKLNPVDP